jgi:hypothetical protein
MSLQRIKVFDRFRERGGLLELYACGHRVTPRQLSLAVNHMINDEIGSHTVYRGLPDGSPAT